MKPRPPVISTFLPANGAAELRRDHVRAALNRNVRMSPSTSSSAAMLAAVSRRDVEQLAARD